MWIKICANTTLEDTELAIQLGADAVGFVFAPSKRQVTAEQIAAITAGLTPASLLAERIGVFQDATFEEICSAVQLAGLTGVQLHNEPDHPLIDRLRQAFGAEITLTQTLHWTVDGSAPANSIALRLAEQLSTLSSRHQIDRVLVDSKVGAASGGTGTSFDWVRAHELFRQPGGLPLVLAGGLNPENVGEAVELLNPWGVDVASGVEQVPGRKSPERLRLFFAKLRTAPGNHRLSGVAERRERVGVGRDHGRAPDACEPSCPPGERAPQPEKAG